MDIESELPEDFEDFSDEEKVEALEEIKDGFDEDTDSGFLKKRMVEELISNYSQ
jgi:acyl-CoA-binding protein